MKILRWAAIGLVVLLGVALLVADVVLTRMVNREPLRSQIDQIVDEAVGRDCSWDSVGVGLLPPSLVIEAVRVAGATPEGPAFAEAENVSLQLAIAPLLAGGVVVDSLVVDKAVVHLIQTQAGLQLPQFGGRDEEEAAPSERGEGAAVSLAVRSIDLRDARLVFEDRSFDPPHRWELVDVDARLEGSVFGGSFDIELQIEDSGGGKLEARGTAELEGDLDLEAELIDFELLPFDPYLAAADELAGRVSGKITVRGPAARPDAVEGKFQISDAKLVFDEFSLAGFLLLEFQHSGPWSSPRGSFHIDATQARANLGDVYEKAPGRAASITGKLRADGGKLGFDDVKLTIENAEATGRVDFGDRIHATAAVAPIDLSHWQPLLKPLVGFQMTGHLLPEQWDIWTEPLEIRGRLTFQSLRLTGPEGRSLELNGSLASGDGVIRTEDTVLTVAGEEVPFEGEITDLAGDWRYNIRSKLEKADSNRLMSDFVGHPDTLHGPIDLEVDLNGSLAGEASFLHSLRGRSRFHISPGRLEGVSILQATLEQLDKMRLQPFQGLRLPGGGLAPRFERYYQDDFMLLRASLELQGGVASTRDLYLQAEGYEFKMQGRIDLEDLGLDARAELVLGDELSLAIAQAVGLERIPLVKGFVIPIPRLGGTLTDPKPEPDFAFLIRALTANLPGRKAVEQLLKGADGLMRQPR